MSDQLQSRKLAFLPANSGVGQAELTTPWQQLGEAGAETTLILPEKDTRTCRAAVAALTAV